MSHILVVLLFGGSLEDSEKTRQANRSSCRFITVHVEPAAFVTLSDTWTCEVAVRIAPTTQLQGSRQSHRLRVSPLRAPFESICLKTNISAGPQMSGTVSLLVFKSRDKVVLVGKSITAIHGGKAKCVSNYHQNVSCEAWSFLRDWDKIPHYWAPHSPPHRRQLKTGWFWQEAERWFVSHLDYFTLIWLVKRKRKSKRDYIQEWFACSAIPKAVVKPLQQAVSANTSGSSN